MNENGSNFTQDRGYLSRQRTVCIKGGKLYVNFNGDTYPIHSKAAQILKLLPGLRIREEHLGYKIEIKAISHRMSKLKKECQLAKNDRLLEFIVKNGSRDILTIHASRNNLRQMVRRHFKPDK